MATFVSAEMTFIKLSKIFTAFALLPLGLFAQKTEAAFKKQCAAMVTAFAKQDLKTLNKYVNNVTGVYVITRPGAIDALNHYDSLSSAAFSFYPYKDAKIAKGLSVKLGTAPKYDCGDMKWSKKGFYADTMRYNRLSELMDFLTKNDMGNYSDAQQMQAKELENVSRKVVCTELAKKRGIVFYLTLINKKWYLTLVDTVVGDCGA